MLAGGSTVNTGENPMHSPMPCHAVLGSYPAKCGARRGGGSPRRGELKEPSIVQLREDEGSDHSEPCWGPLAVLTV